MLLGWEGELGISFGVSGLKCHMTSAILQPYWDDKYTELISFESFISGLVTIN